MVESSTGVEATPPSSPQPAAGGRGKKGTRTPRRGPLARSGLLYREVAAELRKVIWPTRRELIGYTTVVLVFVTFMVAIVAGMDLGFVRLAGALFG